jgi:branched-chain amino acid transport system ATP-binding protein
VPEAPLLAVRDLHASIGPFRILQGVDFDVREGETLVLLGRNGAGKTTTLRSIMGFLAGVRGSIRMDGGEIVGLGVDEIARRGVGYVPEDREVFSKLTVAENLRLAERDASPRRQLVEELFPDLLKRASQMAGTLSGGQQQMVSLARALLNENKLLLIDEPTKGLAPKIVQEVAETLERAAETVPILLVEQNLQVVRQLAAGAVVLSGGRVVHTTSSALEFLDNEDLTQRLLGVHADAGHSEDAEAGQGEDAAPADTQTDRNGAQK